MFLPAIARGIIERRRRVAPAEWSVVPDIGPDVPLDRLARGQDRHGGVVAVQPLGGEHMALDQRMKRLQRHQAPTWSASVDTLRSMPSRR
jgi:hypothetical protein